MAYNTTFLDDIKIQTYNENTCVLRPSSHIKVQSEKV